MAQAAGSEATVNSRQEMRVNALLLLDRLPVVYRLAKVRSNPRRCLPAVVGVTRHLPRFVGRHEQHALHGIHLQRFPR